MTVAATARKREKLATQPTWLANRGILNLPEDRRHGRIVPRHPAARLILPDGSSPTVRIIDISLSGAGIATLQRPEVGSAVTLGKIPGRVVRHLEEGFAMEFTRLQHPDSLEENVAAQ
jgi:PilZ domain-containing protein